MKAVSGVLKCPLLGRDVLGGVEPRRATAIEKAVAVVDFEKGETLFHEGTPADNLFCVESGLAKLYRTWSDGRHYILGVAGPGEMMGYASVLDGQSFALTAQAVAPSRVSIVPAATLRELLELAPRAATLVAGTLARALHLREDQCLTLALRSVPERVARLLERLASLAPGAGDPVPAAELRIHLPLRRIDMAEMVGTTPETLSRILHDLDRQGVIALERREFRILDPDRLREAGGESL